MVRDFLDELSKKPEIIESYDLLDKIGIWKHLNLLNDELKSRDELLYDALEIFNKRSVDSLISYLVEQIFEKFIPSSLVFIIQDEMEPDLPQISSFDNMELTECSIELAGLKSLKPYKKLFSFFPCSITFEAFRNIMDDKNDADIFRSLEPEILVPMMGLEGMYGFIIFGKKILDKPYDEKDMKYVDVMMKFASISLQNIIHYKRAIIDSKTALYKHSFFLDRFEEELARISRHHETIAVLIIDIDFFKKINDVYGHLAGDKILYELALIIKQGIRKEDVAARFGGEEFVVLLIECDVESVVLVAERIRERVEKSLFRYGKNDISITISIGISFSEAGVIHEKDEYVRRADVALYYSKQNGRNRVTVYSKELEDSLK